MNSPNEPVCQTDEADETAELHHGWDRLRTHWLVACASGELKKQPIARTVLNQPLVLFRSADGVTALHDSCPHRNAPLSAGRIVDGCVQCPYHGWRFDHDGQCSYRPGVLEAAAPAPDVRSFAAIESNGLVWVNFNSTATQPPTSRPWATDETFGHFTWIDTVSACFVDALENLLDATHTPFVHSGLVRSEGKRQTFSAIVRIQNEYAEAEYIDEGLQAGWISKLFERNRRNSFGRFIPPCLAELEYTSTKGTEFVLNSWFTPETHDCIRVYSTIYLRRSLVPVFAKRMVISPFFKRVLKQDQDILKQQQTNIQRCGRQFTSWDGDVLRGWIETWLRTGTLPDTADRRIDFEL